VPTQYDLPYEDLTLVTRDAVKIKCYLLMQRKELNLATKTTFESLQEAEDPPEKVGLVFHPRFLRTRDPQMLIVCRRSANDYHVPWEWREHGTSNTTCKGFLREDALQCDDGLLSRVGSPPSHVRSISQCTRYGLSEGSPSEEGTFSVICCDRTLMSPTVMQAFK